MECIEGGFYQYDMTETHMWKVMLSTVRHSELFCYEHLSLSLIAKGLQGFWMFASWLAVTSVIWQDGAREEESYGNMTRAPLRGKHAGPCRRNSFIFGTSCRALHNVKPQAHHPLIISPKEKPLRLPVWKVHDVPDAGCVIVGRVETGSIRPGTKVTRSTSE